MKLRIVLLLSLLFTVIYQPYNSSAADTTISIHEMDALSSGDMSTSDYFLVEDYNAGAPSSSSYKKFAGQTMLDWLGLNVEAATGDSATAFFDAGTIEHERGGLEADVSAYDGLIKISGGSTSQAVAGTDYINAKNVRSIDEWSGDLDAAVAALDVAGNAGESFTIVLDQATSMSADVDLSSLTNVSSIVLVFLNRSDAVLTLDNDDDLTIDTGPAEYDFSHLSVSGTASITFNYSVTARVKTYAQLADAIACAPSKIIVAADIDLTANGGSTTTVPSGTQLTCTPGSVITTDSDDTLVYASGSYGPGQGVDWQCFGGNGVVGLGYCSAAWFGVSVFGTEAANTTAFANAVTAIPSDGGHLDIPIYGTITGNLVINKDNITVTGLNQGATELTSTTSPTLLLGLDDKSTNLNYITVSDLAVTGQESGTFAGVRIKGVKRYHLYNIYVHNVVYGFHITGDQGAATYFGSIENTQIFRCSDGSGGGIGIYAYSEYDTDGNGDGVADLSFMNELSIREVWIMGANEALRIGDGSLAVRRRVSNTALYKVTMEQGTGDYTFGTYSAKFNLTTLSMIDCRLEENPPDATLYFDQDCDNIKLSANHIYNVGLSTHTFHASFDGSFMDDSYTFATDAQVYLLNKSINGVTMITGMHTKQDITYSASITPDIEDGHIIKVATVSGDMTINAPTNPHDGAIIYFLFYFSTDFASPEAITWDSAFKVDWTDPDGVSGWVTVSFVYETGVSKWIQIGQQSSTN